MFQMTDDQRDIQNLAREFAEKEVAPIAAEIDVDGHFPQDTVDKLADLGFMGLCVPEEYGGVGLDSVAEALVVMELAKVCASTAVICSLHYMVSDIILEKGTEEQKENYLSRASEGKLGCFCLTEPGAGTDAGGLKTTAVKDGDSYILNGTKCFITNAGPEQGDHFVVFALTDPEKKTHGGITAFLVDRDNPGLSIGKTEDKLGIRASKTSEVILEDCRVSEDAILGEIGEGFKIAMWGLDGGRIGIAAQAAGIAQGALAEAVNYANERVQFGKPLSKNQGLQWYIADMATRTEAARLLVLEAAQKRADRDADAGCTAAMAKLFAGEAACYVTDLALQIHGGYGFIKEYPIERMYRDARITRIYEGTSEAQKMVISRAVLR
ncbi:MAG: acyl-CoA dehydrogenase family protein [Eubacterium sp.]|nr:acyl-CoA dehydrogenase family protein [Eubacterium sp.]MBQ9062441.1 acyl-CoA dehydrogenase family protein [Eubacterium sp.]